ncbi:MAG: helix-turn-helix transcriptional regulator [Algicola sp.]|nr:helix-turn-helix transcriptional regulator [Algicola sp.]
MRYWPISLLILSFYSFANDMATQQTAINMFSYVALTSVCLFLLMRTRYLHLQSAQRSNQLQRRTDSIENLKNQNKTMPETAPIAQQNDVTLHMNLKDQLFVERFEAIIAKNYQLNTFNRSHTASEMAISERQLNRKLGLLTEDNFSGYLRKYRLKQAVCLMGKGLQVSQIGDQVGFSSATYFSSCFKTEYGKTVKQYEQQIRG